VCRNWRGDCGPRKAIEKTKEVTENIYEKKRRCDLRKDGQNGNGEGRQTAVQSKRSLGNIYGEPRKIVQNLGKDVPAVFAGGRSKFPARSREDLSRRKKLIVR